MENDDGAILFFIDRTFNPAGVPIDPDRPGSQESILVSMFDPKERTPDVGGHAGAGMTQRTMSESEWKDRKTATKPTNADDIPF